eukprot:jgi/Astpho2/2090/fgenesh1_pg.00038_%23_159_t
MLKALSATAKQFNGGKLLLRCSNEGTILGRAANGRHNYRMPAGWLQISGKHACLRPTQDPQGWTIEDTSSNGTFINGRKINKNQPEPIKAGDVITLAHAESVAAPNAIVYQFAEAPEHASPPEQQPPAGEALAANGKRKSPSSDPLQAGAQSKRPKAEGGDTDKLALIDRQKRRMEEQAAELKALRDGREAAEKELRSARVAHADELQQSRAAHTDELHRASTAHAVELQQVKAAAAALGDQAATSSGARLSLGRLQGRDSCCCMTSVQVAKATEALAAKTEELAAKAAEMEALQQCFNAKHAELEELQAGEGEVQGDNTRLAKEVDKLEAKLWQAMDRADLDSQEVGRALKETKQAKQVAAAAENRRKEVQGQLDELQPQLQAEREAHAQIQQQLAEARAEFAEQAAAEKRGMQEDIDRLQQQLEQARQAAQVASDARQAADEREELARSLMGSVDTKVTLLQQEEASGEDLVRQAGEAVAVLQRLLQEGRNKAAGRQRALWEAKRDLNYGLNGQVATSSDGREASEARRMTQADATIIHGTQQQMDAAGVSDERQALSASATDQGNREQPAPDFNSEAAQVVGAGQHADASTSDQQQQTLMESEQQPQGLADAVVPEIDQEATQVYNGDARAALAALGPETAAAPASPQGQPVGSDMESASQKEQEPAARERQSAEQAVLRAASDDVQMAEANADAADGHEQQQGVGRQGPGSEGTPSQHSSGRQSEGRRSTDENIDTHNSLGPSWAAVGKGSQSSGAPQVSARQRQESWASEFHDIA